MTLEKNTKVEVLDHGYLRYIDSMGSDLSIVRNARVSYDADWRAGENEKGDVRLINYLARNGHNTPFESCTVTFEIKAPIFVFRQWHRHRTQSYNELSARYKALPTTYYIPELTQITTQSADNKQMRTNKQNKWARVIRTLMRVSNSSSFMVYNTLIKLGCPRELARSVLPVGTYSHMFATANLHNWYRFLKERLHPHAQYEIRVYAVEILKILAELYPIATQKTFPDYFNAYGELMDSKLR
jgi:thymidylate synthase (FAD)